MLRFSLSGLVLVFDAVHTTAAMTNATNAVIFGVGTVVAIVSALPEISRWATQFVNGDLFAETENDSIVETATTIGATAES